MTAAWEEAAAWSQFYEDIRPSWGLHFRTNLEYGKLLFRVLAERPRSVLEVGTGAATLSTFLSRLVPRVVTVDFSRDILVSARHSSLSLRGRVRTIEGDAFSLPFADNSFDVAFSAGFFEHFSNEKIGALMGEQLRVARRVIFSVPNADYPSRDFGNERLLSRVQWDDLVRSTGFSLDHSAEYSPIGVAFWKKFPRCHYLAVVRQ